MSEFSESYHLFSTDSNDGVRLLRKAWLRGFVYPHTNGWVTVLPKGSMFAPNKRLISRNRGVLLHLVHAEDHGWSLSVYDGNKRSFHFECSWEDDIEVDQEQYDRDRMVELINSNPYKPRTVTPLDITKIFYISDYEDFSERNPIQEIVSLLGIEHYEWVSYEYAQREYKENPVEFGRKGITLVNGIVPF